MPPRLRSRRRDGSDPDPEAVGGSDSEADGARTRDAATIARETRDALNALLDERSRSHRSVLPASRRGVEALRDDLTLFRRTAGAPLTRGFFHASGLGIVVDAPAPALTARALNRLMLKVGATIAREDGTWSLVSATARGARSISLRWDAGGYAPLRRTLFDLSVRDNGDRGTTGGGRLVRSILTDRKAAGDAHAAELLGFVDRLREPVSRACGEALVPLVASVQRLDDLGQSGVHGDGGRFKYRSVSTVLASLTATKRVSFGVAADGRDDPLQTLSPVYWYYLGDLTIRHGQTYIGDAVAMGAAKLYGTTKTMADLAFVHKVNPADCEQWAIVIDWGAA